MTQNKASSRDDGIEIFERFVLKDTEFVKPMLRETLLKGYIQGNGDSLEAFRMFCDAFGTDPETPVRMVIFRFETCFSNENRLFVLNEAERGMPRDGMILSTIVAGRATLIFKDTEDMEVRRYLHEVCETVRRREGVKVSAVYSRTAALSDIPQIFENLWNCKEYFFYSDHSDVICEEEVKTHQERRQIAAPKYTGIGQAVTGGDVKRTRSLLNSFFASLERHMPPPAVAKTYCLELYVTVIRCCGADMIDDYMKGIDSIQRGPSLNAIKEFITGCAVEIAQINTPKDSIYSPLVKDTLRIINENIGNEKLSLRWIAKNHLFTNVDYLGKVFKKEVSMNFSHYVMEMRMELAKKLIMGGKKDRIYEVAEKLGYGTNSQYFSQVFKKYTGLSPLEYKETTRLVSGL